MTLCKRADYTALILLAALGFAAMPAAHAQLITGTYTGADGAPVSGTQSSGYGYNFLMGNYGASGVLLTYNSYVAANANITGGRGGTANGTAGAMDVVGGIGGTGLDVALSATVTVVSGTFRGGDGAAATGTASDNQGGGAGGDACHVNAASAIINGGTFLGGTGATATGTAPNLYGGTGGSGLNANYGSTVTINGGSFIGGNGAVETNPNGLATDGFPFAGVNVENGTVSIYGGTFTGGTYSATDPHGDRSITYSYGLFVGAGSATLYGSGFTVNGMANYSGAIPVGTGTITGMLQNNAVITTVTYDVAQDGTLNIAPIAAPEPSTWIVLGIGALGLGVLGLRARRDGHASLWVSRQE